MRVHAVVVACSVLPLLACGRAKGDVRGLPPERVADYVHAVIAADRATYAEEVVHRLQDVDGVLEATEHFREEKTLPLPSQMLRMGAERVGRSGGFRYALISEWAINKANMPRTEFEKEGLRQVAASPDAPYTRYEEAGGREYFMALYADRAVSDACVRCHNNHPESPRRDFERGEVMGAVVVALPLD